MKVGKLIVFEGACDGIGKSTQIKLLTKHLENDGIKVCNYHFPSYGTYQGAPVEAYLRGDFGHPSTLSPYFINTLYAVDRAVTWKEKLGNFYYDGQSILLDRYTTSSLIYQSALIENKDEKKSFINYVVDFEYSRLGVKEPDQVLFLTAPFDLITEMRNSRKENDGILNDIHERDIEFMEKVYENANFVADYLKWDIIECSNNHKMDSVESIHEKVYQLVKR